MDAIGRDTCMRYVISGSIRISSIVDDGRDKGQIESFESDSTRTRRSSSAGNIELIGHARRREQVRHLTNLAIMMHRLQSCRIVRMMQGIETTDDDVIMIVGIVIVIVEITGVVVVGEVVDKSISKKTKVRPVLPVSSLI